MDRVRVRAVALLVVAILLAGGCGSSDKQDSASSTTPTTSAVTSTTARPANAQPTTRPTTTPVAPVPAGYTGFTSAPFRFSLAVPSSWRQVDPASPGANQALRDIVSTNPALGAAIGGADLATLGIRFLASDPASGDSVNVVAKPAIGLRDSDLPELVPDLKAEYAKLNATVLSTRSERLSGHDAIRVTIDLRLAQGTLRQVQYLIAANDFIYFLTLSGTSSAFTTIAETLRV